MKYLLVVGFSCDMYRKKPRARIFVDDKLINEFDIPHQKNNLKIAIEKFFLNRHTLKPFSKDNEFFNLKIKNFPSLQFYEIEIEQKKEQLKLRIDIENNDSNSTNGFITKSTLLNFQLLYFFPYNIKILSHLNTIRMKNIREDKGLTYGIYSVLEPNLNGSSWYIDTDINTKNRETGIAEIYKEIEKIKAEPIPQNELETAKNYYLGSFLKSLDGPFSLADRLKIIIDNKLSDSYYPEFVSILNETTSASLQDLANKYFDTENIVEVVVGKK